MCPVKQVRSERLGRPASNGQGAFSACFGRFARVSSWRSRLCQSWTRSVCAEAHVTGLPDPRPACAEIGTVCSSGRALRRIDRDKSTVFIAEIPDCAPVKAAV